MRARADDIAVLEKAYDLSEAHQQWMLGLHAGMKPYFDRGFGFNVGSWAMEGNEFSELSPVQGNASPEATEIVGALVAQLPLEVRLKYYGTAASDFIGVGDELWPGVAAELRRQCEQRGVGKVTDCFGLLVMGNPGRNGMVLTGLAAEGDVMTTPFRRKLRRFATHLSAGFRLRVAIQKTHAAPEAVLAPDGRLAHAEGEATNVSARAALTAAVRDIEKSRGRLRRASPEEALLMWKGLVAGRWTIVEWVDTDSRRYLVAHANQLSARDPRALSPRELDVAEYLVQGRSKSEIAYALGLGIGTVSRLSRDVLRKLGAARRTDLAAIFGSVAPFKASVTPEGDVQVLGAGSNTQLWERLTTSERDVVEQVLSGSAPAEIATRRRVSAKTITNQLGQVYARFGVRGRTELASLLGAAR